MRICRGVMLLAFYIVRALVYVWVGWGGGFILIDAWIPTFYCLAEGWHLVAFTLQFFVVHNLLSASLVYPELLRWILHRGLPGWLVMVSLVLTWLCYWILVVSTEAYLRTMTYGITLGS